jgi:hypothetical protein
MPQTAASKRPRNWGKSTAFLDVSAKSGQNPGQSLYSPKDTAIEVQKQGQTENKRNHFVALGDRQ